MCDVNLLYMSDELFLNFHLGNIWFGSRSCFWRDFIKYQSNGQYL